MIMLSRSCRISCLQVADWDLSEGRQIAKWTTTLVSNLVCQSSSRTYFVFLVCGSLGCHWCCSLDCAIHDQFLLPLLHLQTQLMLESIDLQRRPLLKLALAVFQYSSYAFAWEPQRRHTYMFCFPLNVSTFCSSGMQAGLAGPCRTIAEQ